MSKPSVYSPLPPASLKLAKDVFRSAHQSLLKADNPGLKALQARGLGNLKVLKQQGVGYLEASLEKKFPTSKAAQAALRQIGLVDDSGKLTLSDVLVIPCWEDDGQLAGWWASPVTELTDMRWIAINGQVGVFNSRAASIYEELVLCSTVWEALSLLTVGISNVIAVSDLEAWLQSPPPKLRRLILEPKLASEEQAVASLKLARPQVELLKITLPDRYGIHSLNDYLNHLIKVEKVSAAVLLKSMDVLLKKAKPACEAKPEKLPLKLERHTDEQIRFSRGNMAYRIRGLMDNDGLCLRVVLSAITPDASHTDRFDLYSAKGRSSFAYRSGQKFSISADEIEDDLTELMGLLESMLEENRGEDLSPEVPAMSAQQQKAALSLLKSPKLLRRVTTDLEKLGHVGEDANKQLTYLIAISRRQKKPLSGIVRSESATGKSFLMECVAELIPEEEVLFFSRLTPQSLYYMGRDDLKHKLLIVDERNGSEDSEYPIRTLQTRRKLTLAVPQKNPKTGNVETKVVEINGPIAYMESTTAPRINPENENRSFEIYLDESPEQTARVFEAQKRSHVDWSTKAEQERQGIRSLHQNAQRLLEPVRVVIPYAEQLKFPKVWTRSRRDLDRLLGLVEVSAFLHQKQRKELEPGVIEASLDDYRVAFELARESLGHAWNDLPRSARQVLGQIEKMVFRAAGEEDKKPEDVTWRRRDVRAFTGLPDHIVKRAMRTLEDLEYVCVRKSRRGGFHLYRLVAAPAKSTPLDELTSPEALAELLQSKGLKSRAAS